MTSQGPSLVGVTLQVFITSNERSADLVHISSLGNSLGHYTHPLKYFVITLSMTAIVRHTKPYSPRTVTADTDLLASDVRGMPPEDHQLPPSFKRHGFFMTSTVSDGNTFIMLVLDHVLVSWLIV